MKVKVKHIQQPHQAHRVDVPNRTLGDLRSAVVGTLAFTEGAAAADVSISLNKKDAIQGDNSSSLASLGICSGDLLWVLTPPLSAAAAAVAAVQPAPPAAAAAQERADPQYGNSSLVAGTAAAPVPAAAHSTAAPSAMDVDIPAAQQQQQQQEQLMPDAAAEHADDADEHHLQALQAELNSSPTQPWTPDSLARLLSAAAAAAASSSGPEQQQQQHMPLTPAQVLVLTAHVALLECGFVHIAPAAPAAAAAAKATAAFGCGSSSSSSKGGSAAAAEQVLPSLKGPSGIFALSYRLPQDSTVPAAAAAAAAGEASSASVELRGIDMGHHLVLIGSIKAAESTAAAAGGSSTVSKSSTMVATVNLPKAQISPPVGTEAATAAAAAAAASAGQQQQQRVLAGYPVCSYQDLPRLWVQLKDQIGLPLLMASCAAAGLPAPLGLNSLTYELQESILCLLKAKDLAALCCSCSPMRHRASTDSLWKPLLDEEFPPPAEQQQEQQRGSAKPPAQQQQGQGQQAGPVSPAVRASSSGASVATAGSSSSAQTQAQPQQQQQQQQEPEPLHARLQFLLSHGQRYTLRQSLVRLRQEAGRRGWKWAFGAAWTQRARLLADSERSRRMAPILQGPPHPNPMPWGPFRPRQPIMPPHIIGGDYDRFPNVALGGAGLFGGLPGGLGGVGFSGGGVNLGFGGGGVAGLGPGSGGAMFSGGGGALGQAGPMPAGFGGGVAGVPRSGGGRRGNSCSNTRLC